MFEPVMPNMMFCSQSKRNLIAEAFLFFRWCCWPTNRLRNCTVVDATNVASKLANMTHHQTQLLNILKLQSSAFSSYLLLFKIKGDAIFPNG